VFHVKQRRHTTILTRDELLAPRARWPAGAKVDLLEGLRKGVITLGEAQAAHGVSAAELADWRAAYQVGGQKALRITRRTPLAQRDAIR
jgi:hypothetical protein